MQLIKVGVGKDRYPELPPERERQGQGQDPVPELVQIGIGQDAIGVMNMTISLENALTSCGMRSK